MHEVVCKDTILGTMGFITHHYYVMIWIDRFGICLVELLYQREYERRIALQFLSKVITAMGDELLGFQTAQQSAVLKGIAYLLVQFVAVGQYHNRR